MRAAWCLLLAAALLTAGCKSSPDDDEQAPTPQRLDASGHIVLTREERTAIGLRTTVVHKGVLTRSSLRFGKVVGRPQENALVVAPVTGRLAVPKVALGTHVSIGDEIVTLQPLVSAASQASLQAQRRQLLGQVAGAQAEVKARQDDLDRVSRLSASGLSTEAAKAQAKAALTAEQARAKSLQRAASDLARLTGGRIQLRAPVSGVVASLETDTGALVDQGAVIARIVQPGPRWIDLAVPPGDPVSGAYRVKSMAGSVSAKLLSRGALVEPDGTRRDRLEAPQEAAATLPPGAIVAVEVRHPTHGVLVPTRAVVRRGTGSVVFVQASEGRYAVRTVQVGGRDAEEVVVSSGLVAGARVVSRGAWALLGVLARAPPESGDGG